MTTFAARGIDPDTEFAVSELPECHWSETEIDATAFADVRLGHRFGGLLKSMSDHIGESVPYACDDWANTKAAYRFLSNERVTESDILAGHFAATAKRFEASSGTVLLIQDTTEFIYKRQQPDRIGFTKSINSGRDKSGRIRHHTLCGILMHSCLAVTADGLALGLPAVKFWTRRTFKGTAQLKKHVNPTRLPIEQKESVRWLDTLREATRLLGDPGRAFMSVTGRAIFTNSIARRRNSARILSCAPALTGLPETAITPSPRKWRRPGSEAFTRLKSAMTRAS